MIGGELFIADVQQRGLLMKALYVYTESAPINRRQKGILG
jgi:hypothetical protein